MIIRKDVMRIAERYTEETKLSIESIYWWMMETARSLGKHPRYLEFVAGEGIIFVKGLRDSYCLEDMKRITSKPGMWIGNGEEADYWEGRILERQERMDY